MATNCHVQRYGVASRYKGMTMTWYLVNFVCCIHTHMRLALEDYATWCAAGNPTLLERWYGGFK